MSEGVFDKLVTLFCIVILFALPFLTAVVIKFIKISVEFGWNLL